MYTDCHCLQLSIRKHIIVSKSVSVIRCFPAREFYGEALQDAEDLECRTTRKWHRYRCFAPFCFFDLHEGKESQPSGSGSWVNTDEVEFVILMYHKLVAMYPELRSSSQLTIISPYRHQAKLLQDRFKESFGQDSQKFVGIQTVDGFQGREKDVAIFSCVRANEGRGIGFVSDARRMNVSITRVKSTVLVVGSASTLKCDEHWKNLIESAESRNSLFKVSKPFASYFSDANVEAMKVEEKEERGRELGEGMEGVTAEEPLYGNNMENVVPEDNNGNNMEMDEGGYDGD